MTTGTINTSGHTDAKGVLNLSLDIGVSDADVAISVRVKTPPPLGHTDPNGWPKGFFERIPGSMPELSRAPQGRFEDRAAFE